MSKEVVKSKVKKSVSKRQEELKQIQEDKSINIELLGININIAIPDIPIPIKSRTVLDLELLKVSVDI